MKIYLEMTYIAKGCHGQWDKGCRTADAFPFGACQPGDMERAIHELIEYAWYFLKTEELFLSDMADTANSKLTEFWDRGFLEELILKDLRELHAFVLKFDSGQAFSIVEKMS